MGKQTERTAKRAAKKEALNAQAAEQAKQTEKPMEGFKDKQNIMWPLLSGAMAITITFLVFFPQNLGGGITSVYSVMVWWGVFGMFLFRYLNKAGSIGFIGGSAIGMLLHIFAPVFAALMV
jgi:hypothetical protein